MPENSVCVSDLSTLENSIATLRGGAKVGGRSHTQMKQLNLQKLQAVMKQIGFILVQARRVKFSWKLH